MHTQAYGPVETWYVSQVTDFSWLFCGYAQSYNAARGCRAAMQTFNGNVTRWDLRNAVTVEGMPARIYPRAREGPGASDPSFTRPPP